MAKNLDNITGGVAGMPDIPYLSIGRYVLGKDWQIFYLCGAFLIFFSFLCRQCGADTARPGLPRHPDE